MLGFRWMLEAAGAPDQDDDYLAGVDRLFTQGSKGMPPAALQDFKKPDESLADPSPGLQASVDQWLANRHPRVVVMVHGFDFSVKPDAQRADDPFNRVYALPGAEVDAPVRPESWLPIVGETDADGTALEDCAIGFGWESLVAFFTGKACLQDGFQYAALDVAPLASKALATVLLAFRDKGVAISMLAHSLGTRVAVQALRRLADGGLTHLVDRVVLLEGSEFSVDAFDAASRLPNTEFFNIGNQDDHWPPRGAWICHPFRYNNTPGQRVVAYDGIDDLPNLVDLQIDRAPVQAWAATQSYALDSGPAVQAGVSREAHWAGYIHAGNRSLLHDVLRRPDRSVAWFRDMKAPLGFARAGYGGLAGIPIPPMIATCAGRQHAITHEDMPPVA